MNFDQLVRERQSCRAYRPESVPHDTLARICETALAAPSACNSQPWRIYVAETPETVRDAASAFRFAFCAEVPAFAVLTETQAALKPFVMERHGDSQYFAQIDMGILAAHLTLAARDEGVSSCILGMFDETKLRAALGIPDTERVRLVVSLGYAQEQDPLRPKIRKPIGETLKFR